jgi:hypothetical protein
VGGNAEWKDLLISFEIARQSVIAVSALSGQELIGKYTISVKDLLAIATNADGHTEYKAPILNDGKLAGHVALLLQIDRFNRFGFGESALLSDTHTQLEAVEGEESLELDAKTYKSHDITVSPITLPFVLRLVRVIVLDIHPDLRRYFEGPSTVLRVSLQRWRKHTPSCATSGPVHNLGEWVDAAWVFVITNANAPLEIAVMSGNDVVGDLRVAISDVVATPPSARGLVELPVYLFRGGKVPCGKMKVCLSVAPYSSPVQNNHEVTISAIPRQLTPARSVGHLRIKLVRVVDLFQVYGLFPNSPKVSISFGGYKNSTSVAVDAGSDCTWSDLDWGRIPILEGTKFIAKITSGNELIGTFEVSPMELFTAAARNEPNTAVLVEGDILDGAVSKGRFEMRCIPTLFVTMHSIAEGEDESDRASTPADNERLEDYGVGAHVSWVSSVSGGADADAMFNSQLQASTTQASKNVGLSASTPTPDVTIVSFCGVSVYDLKPLSAVFRNSPQVQIACDEWRNETTAASFAGASADWILKRSAAWEVNMRANTFLKLTVTSGTAVIGAVCISTRELMEVPRDSQGLSALLRDLEHNLEVTGKIRIVANLEFRMEPAPRRESATPSLLTNSFGLPSLASFYPIEKKPSVSNSVIKSNVRGAQESAMVAANNFQLDLPVNMHVMSVTCDGVAPSLLASANALVVVAKMRGEVLHRSAECVNVDRHVEWELLDWDIALQDADTHVNVSLQSALGQVADVSLPIQELLSAPRTSQGYVEITRSLRVMGSSGVAKLQVCMLLTPHLSPELRELYAQQVEEELQRDIQGLPTIAEMSVELISVIDVSPMHGSLSLACTAGEFNVKDCLTFNRSGSAVWGSLVWQNIPVMERTNMVLMVSSGDVVLGKVLFSAAELLACPVDQSGLAVIYGELLDGLAYRGTVSMAYRLLQPKMPQRAPVSLPTAVIDAQGTVIAAPTASELQKELVTSIVIHAASAKSLKPVHKVGKNSPMLKVEVRGLKFQSNSLPYAGSKADWSDLLWNVDSAPLSKVKVMVTSGSVQVGTATTTNRAMLDVFEGARKDGFLTVDLMKNGAFMGVVTLALRLETRPLISRGNGAQDNVLFVPENPYHIPSDGRSVTSAAGELHASIDSGIMSPDKAGPSGLGDNIEQFRASRRPLDDVSIQSLRSLESSHSGTSDPSEWTEGQSLGGESRSLASSKMLLPPLPEDQQLEYLGEDGQGEALSGHGSARSAASASSNVSDAHSRPKSSRGPEAAPPAALAETARAQDTAGPASVASGALSVAASGMQSAHSLSVSASLPTTSGGGGSDTSRSTSSFSIDSVNSSYIMHSADLAEYRERTIHTIREGSEGSSAASRSLQHSSRSEDSSTAFDSSVSQSSLGDSFNRSIYSESNSLSGSSAYTYGMEPDRRSYATHSLSTSEFGTEVDSSSKSVASESFAVSQATVSVRTPTQYDSESISQYTRSVDRSSLDPSSASLSASRMSQSLSRSLASQHTVSVSSRDSRDVSGTEGSWTASDSAGASESRGASGGASRSVDASKNRSSYTDSRGPVSFFQPRISGNTASFLQGTSNAPSGHAHSAVQSRPGVVHGPPPKATGGSGPWVGADASTIATEETSYAFSEDGDKSEASSEYSRSSGYSSTSGSSYESAYSQPSRAAHTIYSGYRPPLSAGSSRYSDYTSEGSQTSRSRHSEDSDYSYASSYSRSSYGASAPRSQASHRSSQASSDYSSATPRSEVSGIAFHPQQPAGVHDIAPAPLQGRVDPRAGHVAPALTFSPVGLQWLPSQAAARDAVKFTARRIITAVLHSVVDSFVAMATGGDFQAGGYTRQFVTYAGDRQGVVKDLAFHFACGVITHAASHVLSSRCGALAQQLVPAEPRIIAGPGPSTKNPFLDGTLKKRAGITLAGQVAALQALGSGGFAGTECDSDDDPIYGGLVKQGKVEEVVPQKARITFQDILGIDLSFLDVRVMPKRPYLTVCKVSTQTSLLHLVTQNVICAALQVPGPFKCMLNLAIEELTSLCLLYSHTATGPRRRGPRGAPSTA